MSNNALVFSNKAWAKLVHFRDKKDIEIGGFGISSENDPLYVIDFQTTKQEGSMGSIDFDDEDLSLYVDKMDQLGYPARRCFRIWIHTHPGNSPPPSDRDWETIT